MGKGNTFESARAEKERVKALLLRDSHERAIEAGGRIDPATGEPRRIPPTQRMSEIRTARSNGMPAEETVDTIGRLWAWGLLSGGRIPDDLLRDAGRRYAAAYWWRYGPVSARSGPYEEMTGRSAGGPKPVVVPDPKLDVLAEERFRRRDDALRAVRAKRIVDEVCVVGAGDNDPSWLTDLMAGYPSATSQERLALAEAQANLGRGTAKDQERAARREADAQRRLKAALRRARMERLPHALVHLLVVGLVELALVDRADGFHKPKRGPMRKIAGNRHN